LIEVVPPNDRDPNAQKLELSNRVRRRQLHAFLVVGREVLHPSRHQEAARLEYHAQGSALDDVRRWIGQPVNDRLRELRLAEMGLEQAKVKDLFNWLPVEGMDLVSADAQTGQIKKAEKTNEARAIGVPMVTMILLFLLVMMGATPLLQAVMEEKNQRIAEVLLGCLPPFQLMLGKLAGGLAVSLTGSAVYVSAALLLLGYLGAADWIPYQLLPWFFVFMFGAVVMTGALFAATGSLCNDPKQAQTWTLPALLPLMIPMFSLVPILQAPRSTFATVFSLIPPFTPLVMLLRQSTAAGVPAWQPWVGLAGMLLFTTLVVWVSGRIFRLGLLLQGKPPRVTEVLRWALRG
jgi:ABC-type Na+ efflux pump permease subunit